MSQWKEGAIVEKSARILLEEARAKIQALLDKDKTIFGRLEKEFQSGKSQESLDDELRAAWDAIREYASAYIASREALDCESSE